MSALEGIRSTLSTTLYSEFVAAHPTVPISFENQRTEINENGTWVKAAVLPSVTHRADIGSNASFKSFGVVNVQVMSAEEKGTKEGLAVVDTLLQILLDRNLSIPGGGSITLYEVNVNPRGVLNGWHSYAVTASYRAFVTISR